MTFLHVAILLASAVAVLVVLPRIIFPLDQIEGTAFDRVVAGAVLITALSLGAMYLLGSFGLLELASLIGVWFVTWWFLKGRHRERRFGGIVGLVGRAFAASDDVEARGARAVARDARGSIASPKKAAAKLSIRDRIPPPDAIILAVAILVVLVVSAYLRFARALTHPELVPQDSYLALFWTKSINSGTLLGDGIYPQGAYLWTSLVDRFFPFGTYTFMRFAGPMMNVLELIAMYWVASRAARSRAAGLLTIAVFGFFAGHPALLVVWERQIGAMTQEFALAFGMMGIVFGARYVSRHDTWNLVLTGCCIFVAVTTHALVIPFLLMGFAIVIVVGLATGAFTSRALGRLVAVGVISAVAANYYFLLGLARGLPLAQSFEFYDPTNPFEAYGGAGEATAPGFHLSSNLLYILGTLGGLGALAAGLFLALTDSESKERGRTLAIVGGSVVAMALFYDLVAVQIPGVLFRVRQGWITGAVIAVGIGLLAGAVVAMAGWALRAGDLLRREATGPQRGARAVVELGVGVLAALMVTAMAPSYASVARVALPSGYPQATEASLEILNEEEALRFTFVGLSEQYQEAYALGFFVEAWVFARDITIDGARDPSHQVPIPTDRIYIFAEKEPFPGPQTDPFGPTEEFYRNDVKRRRIMQRIIYWAEEYRRYHDDMTVEYEDDVIRVYKISRTVDLNRANMSAEFKDYSWERGELFDDDGDVTANRVVPASQQSAGAGGPPADVSRRTQVPTAQNGGS